jgi:WS/DGAT/MGAT family acyltransferase
MDASFVYFETPNSPGHIFSCSIYDPSTAPGGAVTFKGILEHYAQRLHVTPTFRQRLVQVPMGLDHPYWMRDPNFDLEFHVRHIALPKPGDWRQLCIQVARLHSRALDMNRPLWEATVIEGLDNVEGIPPGSFAVMQKTHHAAIDGISMIEIISAVHDHEPDAEPPAPEEEWKPEREPTPWELLSRAAVNTTLRPMRFARLMARSAPGGVRLEERRMRQRLDVPRMEPAPRTRFSGSVSGHRVVEARRYDLGEVRRMKSAVTGATVNDVVIAIVGGALRNYLAEKGELPKESLRVMAPISTRTADQAGSGGNQVSAMVANLGTDIEDPRERLQAVQQSTHESKLASRAVDARALAGLSEFLPGGLAAIGARLASQFEMATRTTPVVNCVVSNVPGPQNPLYFAGARLVTFFGGAAVADGMGLLHGVASYCGELMLSVVSDRTMMPDPGRYAECLDASYAAMAKATL